MVGYLKIFGYLWLGNCNFWAQNNFSSAPTLGINNDRSLSSVQVAYKKCKPLLGSRHTIDFWFSLVPQGNARTAIILSRDRVVRASLQFLQTNDT